MMFEIGSNLREERHRRRLDLSDVEAATHIRITHLEALEREQFDLLPPGMYRRSFLREYAEFLGLDGDAFTEEYDLRFAPPEPEPERHQPRPAHPSTVALLAGRHPLRRIAAVAVIAVIGVGVWLLSRGRPPATPIVPPATSASPAAHAPSPRRHRTTPAVSPKRTNSLTLTAARGTCWLQVQLGSANGTTIYEQTLQQGQTVRFGLRHPLYLRLGAPWNLNATIADHPVTNALPTQTGNVLANTNGLTTAH